MLRKPSGPPFLMVSVIEVTPESIEEDHTLGLLVKLRGSAHTETCRQPLHTKFLFYNSD